MIHPRSVFGTSSNIYALNVLTPSEAVVQTKTGICPPLLQLRWRNIRIAFLMFLFKWIHSILLRYLGERIFRHLPESPVSLLPRHLGERLLWHLLESLVLLLLRHLGGERLLRYIPASPVSLSEEAEAGPSLVSSLVPVSPPVPARRAKVLNSYSHNSYNGNAHSSLPRRTTFVGDSPPSIRTFCFS